MGVTGCCRSPSLWRTGLGKGRRYLQSPKLLWNAICLVFLTWICAVRLEWFLSRTAYQGHCYLNLNSGLLKFPRLWCLTSAVRRSGKSLTILQKQCLSVCSWGLSSYSHLPLSHAKENPALPAFQIVTRLLVYGTWDRGFGEVFAFSALVYVPALSYWFFCCFSGITNCDGNIATMMISSSIWFVVAKSNSI